MEGRTSKGLTDGTSKASMAGMAGRMVRVEFSEQDWDALERVRRSLQERAPDRLVTRADAMRAAVRGEDRRCTGGG